MSTLLLAKGRGRLETAEVDSGCKSGGSIPYSLGDAIDWKPKLLIFAVLTCYFSYSLGDAIDWKLNNQELHTLVGDTSPTR